MTGRRASVAWAVRGALKGAVRVDRGAFAPALGLRAAVGVAAAVGIGAATGRPVDGVLAAVGALQIGAASLGGVGGASLATMTPAGFMIALSTFVGSLVGHHLYLELPVLAVWAIAAGLSVALGQAATVVGVQALVGLVVLGRFPLPVGQAASAAGFVLAGAAGAIVLVLAAGRPVRYRRQRYALADLAAELAAWARDPDDTVLLSRTTDRLADAARVLRVLAVADVTAADVLTGTLELLRRGRAELAALTVMRDADRAAELRPVLAAAATVLDGISGTLRTGHPLPDLPDRLARATLLASSVSLEPLTRRQAHRLLTRLEGAVDLATGWHGRTVRRRILIRPLDSMRGVVSVLRAALRPQAPELRHALRLTVVLEIATVFTRTESSGRGYWVLLTAILVLKPDYGSTVERSLARLGGTLVGVVLASLLAARLDPQGAEYVLFVGLAAWAAYGTFGASYALFSIFVTVLVVLLIAPADPRPYGIVAERAADTAIGGGLALLSYALWPTWEHVRLPESLARLLDAGGAYADAVLSPYAESARVDRQRLDATAGRLRTARSAAEGSVRRTRPEPRASRLTADIGEELIAASRLVALTLQSLDATLRDVGPGEGWPAFGGFRTAVLDLLAALAATLRGERAAPAEAVARLQGALVELERSPGPAHEKGQLRRLLIDRSRLLAEAVDGVARAVPAPL